MLFPPSKKAPWLLSNQLNEELPIWQSLPADGCVSGWVVEHQPRWDQVKSFFATARVIAAAISYEMLFSAVQQQEKRLARANTHTKFATATTRESRELMPAAIWEEDSFRSGIYK